MTRLRRDDAKETFKTLDELFAAVRKACATEWERNFEYHPNDEEIASWAKWTFPETDEWWSRHREPHAIELEARRIHADIGAALVRLDALAAEASGALNRRITHKRRGANLENRTPPSAKP